MFLSDRLNKYDFIHATRSFSVIMFDGTIKTPSLALFWRGSQHMAWLRSRRRMFWNLRLLATVGRLPDAAEAGHLAAR